MTREDAAKFVEIMAAIEETWTEEQVMEVYGDKTLEEAVHAKMHGLDSFFEMFKDAGKR